jgi:hypothetical protein
VGGRSSGRIGAGADGDGGFCRQGEAVFAVSQGKCGSEWKYEEEVERLYAESQGV